ncbi:MAG: hypothetical protein ABR570_12940 [Burkholderiales bacterium]
MTVVGHCTSTTARILCASNRIAPGRGRIARLVWRAADALGSVEIELAAAPPYELGVFNLRDLPAGAEVVYGIALGEDAAALPAVEEIGRAATARFRLLPPARAARSAPELQWHLRDER